MGKKSLLSSQPPPFYASISCHISVHYYGRNKLKISIHYYAWKRLAKGQSSKRIIRLCFFAFCVSFAVNLVTTRSTFQPAQHGSFVEPGAGAAQPRNSRARRARTSGEAARKLLPPKSPRGFSALARLYYLERPTKTAMLRRLFLKYFRFSWSSTMNNRTVTKCF